MDKDAKKLKENTATIMQGMDEVVKFLYENQMQDFLINYIDDDQYMIRKVPLCLKELSNK